MEIKLSNPPLSHTHTQTPRSHRGTKWFTNKQKSWNLIHVVVQNTLIAASLSIHLCQVKPTHRDETRPPSSENKCAHACDIAHSLWQIRANGWMENFLSPHVLRSSWLPTCLFLNHLIRQYSRNIASCSSSLDYLLWSHQATKQKNPSFPYK